VDHVVVATSQEFDAAAVSQALHCIGRASSVGGIVTADEMVRVYTQRMAKHGAPGRIIYDDLIAAPSHGRCPLCGHRLVTMLDHHLPKAHFPALTVAPLNLVPSCGDCNKAKLDSIPLKAVAVSLHPYFDSIDSQRWLKAQVIETQPAAVRFCVEAPHTWGEVLELRVRNHFEMMGLAKLYGSQAAEELLNIRHQPIDLHTAAGMASIRSELEARAVSCAHGRRNGWRTATYEAWAASDWFCDGGFAPVG
jgi:hypothetical protein